MEGSQSEGEKDSSDELDIVLLRDPYDHPAPAAHPLGPAPPPRRTSRGQSPTEPGKQPTVEEKKASDLIDLSGGLFGEATGEGDEDAPPPTLWWDDIGMTTPINTPSSFLFFPPTLFCLFPILSFLFPPTP